ncbi:MAG: O-antigen ligase family protein, partial [Nitrososphaera sp.]|nr:O-antigen ligase family protein [Nitrososphaera sp.]
MKLENRDGALFTSLMGLFVLAPLPLGSNREWAWLTLSGLSFLLMALWCRAYILGRLRIPETFRSMDTKAAVLLFLGAALWICFQIVPLPSDLVTKLAPSIAAFYHAAYAVIQPDAPPDYLYLTLDRGATLHTALRSLAYWCLFLLVLLVVNNRHRLKIFCYTIVASGFFQAVYGSIMTLSGLEYLLFTKKYAYVGFATGTFVNRNHLAGYLEMALAIGIGLLLMTGKEKAVDPSSRWRGRAREILRLLLSQKAILRLMMVVMVVGLILSRSRMGNVAFFTSLLITGCIAIAFSKPFRRVPIYILLSSIVAIDIYLLGVWFGLEEVAQRLEQTHLSTEHRDEVIEYAIPMIEDFWLSGTGAGTFIYVFSAYVKENFGAVYDHAHNDYLELVSELGVIGFSLLCVFTLLSLFKSFMALRDPANDFVRATGFAGFMGTLSLLIHSTADFNLYIPANAMLFIAILALPFVVSSLGTNRISLS